MRLASTSVPLGVISIGLLFASGVPGCSGRTFDPPADDGGGGGAGGVPSSAGGGDSLGGGGLGGEGPGGSASGGTDGAGGTPAVDPVYVSCGDVDCPVHEGGKCCYMVEADELVCQLTEASCSTTGTGPYHPRYPITCDGSEDCAAGSVCCYSSSPVVPSVTVACSTSCEQAPASPLHQVCNPEHTAPSDCLIGSCKTGISSVPGLALCQ